MPWGCHHGSSPENVAGLGQLQGAARGESWHWVRRWDRSPGIHSRWVSLPQFHSWDEPGHPGLGAGGSEKPSLRQATADSTWEAELPPPLSTQQVSELRCQCGGSVLVLFPFFSALLVSTARMPCKHEPSKIKQVLRKEIYGL